MDTALQIPPAEIDTAPTRPWLLYAHRTGIWIIIAGILLGAFVAGWNLRRWVFDMAQPIRFSDDLERGFYWGLEASGLEGYLNQYDKMDPQVPEWQDNRWVPWLDYGPLRLLVMREWAIHQRTVAERTGLPPYDIPSLDAWQRDYDFNAFVMHFNITLEFFACVCAFFLTRLWVIGGTPSTERGHFTGVWQGIVAALLLWFSADSIISAHGWFQWDTWPVPWYLLACLLASLDWWLCAGIAVAIGICFKGQMLSISPIFIIWPLVQGRPLAAVRWCIGILLGFAVIAGGWMLTYLPADQVAQRREIQETMAVSDYAPDLFEIPRKFDLPAAIWIAEMLIMAGSIPWLLRVLRPAPAPAAPVPPVSSPAEFPTGASTQWGSILVS
jgi:hypothetical protein